MRTTPPGEGQSARRGADAVHRAAPADGRSRALASGSG